MKPIFLKDQIQADNLNELLSEDLTLDISVFEDVLKFGFILGEKTPFKEIKRKHKIKINKIEKSLTNVKEIQDLFLKYLKESILKSIGNENKIGLFLSGGIDSNILAIFLGNYFRNLEIHTYTASFKKNENEVKNAQEISKKYKFFHRIVKVNNEDFNKWEEAIKAIGMPIADEASIPLLKMAEKASKDGVKKILMGDGNDELWWGYDDYYILKRLKQIIPFSLPRFGSLLIKLNIPKLRGIGRLLQLKSKNWEEAVYVKNFFDLTQILPYCWLEQRYGIIRYFNLSPEFPYLDQKLIDLACSVPISLKLKGSNKWLIKQAIAQIDPIILKRKKRMMGFPAKEMFKINKNKVIEVIRKAKIVNYNSFDNYSLTHRKFIISLWCKIYLQDFLKNNA